MFKVAPKILVGGELPNPLTPCALFKTLLSLIYGFSERISACILPLMQVKIGQNG